MCWHQSHASDASRQILKHHSESDIFYKKFSQRAFAEPSAAASTYERGPLVNLYAIVEDETTDGVAETSSSVGDKRFRGQGEGRKVSRLLGDAHGLKRTRGDRAVVGSEVSTCDVFRYSQESSPLLPRRRRQC